MKTLKRILSVLIFISLCTASASCARQTDESPQPVIEPATDSVFQLTSAAAETTAAKPVETTERSTASAMQKPTGASTTATMKKATAKPTETTKKQAETTTAKPTTEKPKATAKPTEKATVSVAEYEAEALRLTNEARKRAGLKALGTSAELQRCADVRAKEISQKFSHTRPNGQNCFSLAPDLIMGENIAMGQTTPKEVVDGWMASKSHRENMLRERFTLCAVGCYYSKSNDTYYWVQLFG